MPVADFSLPRWLDQSNTELVPDALAKGAATGAHIAQAIQGARQVEQAQARLRLMQAEDQRRAAEEARRANAEAMRYQGFQNFARDREILKAQGLDDEKATQQSLLKWVGPMSGGNPNVIAGVLDKSADNLREAQRISDLRTHLNESDRLRAARDAALQEAALDKESGLNMRSYDRLAHKKEVDAKDYELELEKEQGRNLRAYEGRTAASKLEEQRQQGRIERIQERAKTSKTIKDNLSDTDAKSMQAELNALQFRGLSQDELANAVDGINAKYQAIKKGPPQDSKPSGAYREREQADTTAVPRKSPLGGAAPEIREDAQKAPTSAEARSRAFKLNGGSDMVAIISPDGRPGMIPRANLEKALKAGYREAK